MDPTDEEPLLCPMCTYSLRGLEEPRCPECGYRFQWDELRDPARRLHRYLFEHHRERNAWSFLRTLIGGVRPHSFWRALFPTQPLFPRRLLGYWMIVVSLSLPPLAIVYTLGAIQFARELPSMRASTVAYAKGPRGWEIQDQLRRNNRTLQQHLDRYLPLFPRPAFFVNVLYNSRAGVVLFCYLWLAVWPWATLGTMLALKVSMRRARIGFVHVMRCAIYCGDVMLWASLALLFPVLRTAAAALRGRPTEQELQPQFVLFGLLIALPVLIYRLIVAYRLYLRFPNSVATVLVTQLLALLLTTVTVALIEGTMSAFR